MNVPSEPRGPRVGFTFEGDLDDVPVDVAETLARAARILVAHSDQHAGGEATVRISERGPWLRLEWSDPECSGACLRSAGDLAALGALPASSSSEVRLVLDDSHGGLRLDWRLLRSAVPTTRSWFPFAGRGLLGRTTKATRTTDR